MKLLSVILIYSAFVNVCVVAKGGHGGGHGGHGGHGSYVGHGGHTGHSSSGYGSYGYHYVTASHSQYTYHPPRSISYTCHYCSSSATYPVYRQQPPPYVYVYKDSDSRYNQLLTGLSLYNLGRTYGNGGHHPNSHYAMRPQERCSMQIIERSYFEETEFPCFMISSFIQSTPDNKTSVDITSSQIDVKPYITKGDPIEVTEAQECVLWHNSTTQKERNHVPCKLLKEYANTVRPSGVPVYIWLPTLFGAILMIYLCCACYSNKKKESIKETTPINDAPVAGYCANY